MKPALKVIAFMYNGRLAIQKLFINNLEDERRMEVVDNKSGNVYDKSLPAQHLVW